MDNPNFDLFDNDSAFEFEGSSSLTSLASAVTRYRVENGRRYHGYRDGAYWAPNDETHNEQQDLAHHLWLLTLDNRLHLAPLPEGVQVSGVQCFISYGVSRRGRELFLNIHSELTWMTWKYAEHLIP